MPIDVKSITFANEMQSGTSTGLIGNAFNKMTATINVNTYKLAIASVANAMEFAPSGYFSDDYLQMSGGGNAFADFNMGDTVVITGTSLNNGTYTVFSKINNYTIRLFPSLNEETSFTSYVECQTDFTSAEFYYGLIENSEAVNFYSKIDGNVMRYNKDTITTSHTSMSEMGLFSSWRLGSVTIKEISPKVSTYGQDFEIIHTFYIHPFFLEGNTLTTPNTWFSSTKCLRYVFALRTKTSSSVTTGSLYKEFALSPGNTGWLNENLNTGITNYSISNLTYTKVSDSSSLDAVMLISGDKTRVNFKINNTTNSPFSNGNTKVKVHVMNVPYGLANYFNTTTDLDDNFTFDTALNTLGSASVDGDFARCIEDFTCTYVSTSQITCQLDINLLLADCDRILNFQHQKYVIAVSVQNHTKTISNTDTVTLSVDYNDYDLQLNTENVVSEYSWDIYEHPFFDSLFMTGDDECFLQDERRSVCVVKIDATDSRFEPSLQSFNCGVRIYNTSTGEELELDGQYLNVSGNAIVNGLQYVDIEIPRTHQAMTSENFKRILIRRELAMDATDVWYYTIDFPFLVRWEDWQSNPAIPSDFFDTSLPNNGLNNDWSYFTSGNWQIQCYVKVVLSFNGDYTEYTLNRQMIPYTYESSTDWINPNINTYDSDGNDLLGNILTSEPTKVICVFEWATGTQPTIDEVEFVLRLEPTDNGGRTISTRFSSVFELTSATQWESTDASNKIVKSIDGNLYYGEAYIDNTLLQNFSSFDITARIYDIRNISNAKLMESGDIKLREDGGYKLLE